MARNSDQSAASDVETEKMSSSLPSLSPSYYRHWPFCEVLIKFSILRGTNDFIMQDEVMPPKNYMFYHSLQEDNVNSVSQFIQKIEWLKWTHTIYWANSELITAAPYCCHHTLGCDLF